MDGRLSVIGNELFKLDWCALSERSLSNGTTIQCINRMLERLFDLDRWIADLDFFISDFNMSSLV